MALIKQHEFQLAGGHPALDFLNTVHDWTVPEPRDYLTGFADAVRFGEMAGLLDRVESSRLRRRTSHAELTRLRGLRELLKQVFQTSLSGQPPSRAALATLSAELAEAAQSGRLITTAGTRHSSGVSVKRQIAAERAGDAVLRFRIAEAGAALLVSDAMLRVKSCPSCGWFFLDVSKNGSRRWCSMETCGAIAKARSYYMRSKERDGANG